jgi:hypothetical protein
MFVFGVDADDVPRLRKERKNFKTDKRRATTGAQGAGRNALRCRWPARLRVCASS